MKAGRFVACLAMFGVGAVAGTLSGGYTNAARSPQATSHVSPKATPKVSTESRPKAAADPTPAVVRASSGMIASLATQPNTTTIAMTRLKAVRAPTAVVAMRFPAQWPQQRATGDNNPPLAMAYVAGAVQAPTAASPSGYQLASVDPDAESTPLPKRKPAAARPPVLFNDAQLASIKKRLRLSRDQERYWPQVERALRAISYKIATQQNAKRPVVRGSRASMIDPNSPEVVRLKSVAFPLIMSMREDQKQEVRQLAHTMGLKQVASMF